MNEMLKQAQKLQKDMEEAQHALETEEIKVSSGGGAVNIKITGSSKFTSIKLSDELIKSDKETLESTLLAAVQEAVQASRKKHEEQMRKITSSLNFPGLGDGGDFEDFLKNDPSLGGPQPKAKRAFDDMDRV